MAFDRKPFGFRWELYVVKDAAEISYVALADCAFSLISLVMKPFIDGQVPVSPWSLHLHCNEGRSSLELRPEHFTNDGKFFAPDFIKQMTEMDSEWAKFPMTDPVFLEAATKKKILGPKETFNGSFESLQNFLQPETPTFQAVMNGVFGRPVSL